MWRLSQNRTSYVRVGLVTIMWLTMTNDHRGRQSLIYILNNIGTRTKLWGNRSPACDRVVMINRRRRAKRLTIISQCNEWTCCMCYSVLMMHCATWRRMLQQFDRQLQGLGLSSSPSSVITGRSVSGQTFIISVIIIICRLFRFIIVIRPFYYIYSHFCLCIRPSVCAVVCHAC